MTLTQAILFTFWVILHCGALITIAALIQRNVWANEGWHYPVDLFRWAVMIGCPVFTLAVAWMSVTTG